MSDSAVESVFIAWGGNRLLAEHVATHLEAAHFRVTVGGGQPKDTFIGVQVLSQIQHCTRAILLVEAAHQEVSEGGRHFSANLMFEWGYISGTFAADRIHVFLIDASTRDLPSDLAGSWATEIGSRGRDAEQVAQEIAEKFLRDASHGVELDKFQVMHSWTNVLHMVEAYNDGPLCSDIELAHHLVHSIETAYYYMEEDRFEELVTALRPESEVLAYAANLVRANIRLFRETGGLQRALPFDSFMELKALFENPYDIAARDLELDLWLRFFALRRLALIHRMVAENPEFTDEDRAVFIGRTLELTNSALAALERVVTEFPREDAYANMYRGYLHRDQYLLNIEAGEAEAAVPENAAAVAAKERFYTDYKNRYPQDIVLTRHLGQEYYLALAEHLDFVQDPIERMMIRTTINSFLSKLERDSGRQHVLLAELRAKVAQRSSAGAQ